MNSSVIAEIEDARQRIGVTAARLATEAGINPSTYSRARQRGVAHDETVRRLVLALERLTEEQKQLAARLKRLGGTGSTGATDSSERRVA